MDASEAVKALIVANHFLETDLEKLKAAVSMGLQCREIIQFLDVNDPPERLPWSGKYER